MPIPQPPSPARKSLPALKWEDCPAKTCKDGTPGVSVLLHCLQVAEVIRAISKRLSVKVMVLIGPNAPLAGALHDIGKISPGFLLKYFRPFLFLKVPSIQSWGLDPYNNKLARYHASISGACLRSYLGKNSLFGDVLKIHHGVWDGEDHPDEYPLFGGNLWAEQRKALLQYLLDLYGEIPEDNEFVFSVLAGLLCVADWIASSTENFPPEGLPPGVTIEQRAEEVVALCWGDPPPIKPGLSFRDIFGFDPYPSQQKFIDAFDGPGIHVYEAPTGDGKTEVALYAAYKAMEKYGNFGIYFALHTRLASGKIHKRFKPFIQAITDDSSPALLTHGTAWLKRFGGGGEFRPGGKWFRATKRAILAPFAVGTIDQALLSVLRVRHYFVRSFGLAGKVVILDEVDSYDTYTSTHIRELVRQLRQLGCTVIILSATLTKSLRNSFFEQPQMFDRIDTYPVLCKEGVTSEAVPIPVGSRKKVKVRIKELNSFQVAQEAIQRAQKGQCVLCIANTVRQAQDWYQCIQEQVRGKDIEVGLLHSRFPQWRRDQIEDKWTDAYGKEGDRPDGAILVSTQVAEQSLDIDADFLITELAPTDRMLQRIGRLFRHTWRQRPCAGAEVLIIAPDVNRYTSEANDDLSVTELKEILGESTCRVYEAYLLWMTYQVWEKLTQISVPEDVRDLNEKTYGKAPFGLPSYVKEALDQLEKKKQQRSDYAIGGQSSLAAPTKNGYGSDEEGVAGTRYSELKTVDVLLVQRISYLANGQVDVLLSSGDQLVLHEENEDIQASVKLHENVFPVPLYYLEGAKVSFPPFLNKHFHKKSGISVLIAGSGGSITPFGYRKSLKKASYTDELGILVDKVN